MTDHSPTPPTPPRRADARDQADADDAPLDEAQWRALIDEIGAGELNATLVRLIADAAHADPHSVVWKDARFVDWWAERLAAEAAEAAQDIPDDEFLAAGRALRARVAAKGLGMVRYDAPPPLYAAPVVALPAEAVDAAQAVGAAPWIDLQVAAGVGRELWDGTVERWLALPDALQALPQTPSAGERRLALRIAGDSMEPALQTGDTVLVALGARPKAGLAVVARHPDDGYVCKRVRRVRARTVELESLAPGRPVITVPRAGGAVLGVVVAAWRGSP